MKQSVAVIGFTSIEDATYLADFMAYMPDTTSIELIPYDLSLNRDFLVSDKCYDYVLLCQIFKFHYNELNDHEKAFSLFDPCTKTSPFHCLRRWRNRLKESGAKMIFTTGDIETSITADYLGEIPGYRCERTWERKTPRITLVNDLYTKM